jgi:hypothetical protein
VLAVCTNATIKGSGLRLVISQPDAVPYIQLPTLETRVAVQITAKTGWRNAAANDPDFRPDFGEGEAAAFVSLMTSPICGLVVPIQPAD